MDGDKKPLADDFEPSFSKNSAIYTQPTGAAEPPASAPSPSPPPDEQPGVVMPIIVSCAVFLFCCWPLGLVAFILSLVAASSSDNAAARSQLRAVFILNATGVLCGIITYAVLLIMFLTVWR